ncbi:hypothetical protein AADZ90_012105 [Aestuariibius sp. 2305UL40-4]|uniref:hypothetical protein n=1 Tax=Aestuariibius violaceus TaxID=3234132 RepID=UPI00345EE9A0
MDPRELSEAELEALFDAVRDEAGDNPSDLPPGLRARILADAHLVTERRALPLWRVWLKAVGGWPTVGGVLAASLAGLWIGVMPPPVIENFEVRLFGEPEIVTVFVDAEFLGEEV